MALAARYGPSERGIPGQDSCSTDETLINLDRLNQLFAIDAVRKRVTVQAGIRIKELNQMLPAHGLGMANLGSIAEQSIAGATATGTHGTGCV